MIALLFVLAVQDTTIVIHPDSAAIEARALPRVIADEVIRFYNDPATTRLVGRTRLPHGNEWRGNVAVRSGPVFVGGRVQGSLVVINGDLRFEAGGEVTGDVIVVGGIADSTRGKVGGELRQYREPLLYRLQNEGDQIEYAPNLRRRLPVLGAIEFKRKRQAEALNTSLNGLRLRASRIRSELTQCIHSCVETSTPT